MKQHISNYLILVIAIIVMLPVSAAAWGENYNLKMDFGTSYKLSLFGQIANPDAEKNLAKVEGQNGQVAEKAMSNYQKEFLRPVTIVRPIVIDAVREYTAPSTVIQVQGSGNEGASLTPIIPAGGSPAPMR